MRPAEPAVGGGEGPAHLPGEQVFAGQCDDEIGVEQGGRSDRQAGQSGEVAHLAVQRRLGLRNVRPAGPAHDPVADAILPFRQMLSRPGGMFAPERDGEEMPCNSCVGEALRRQQPGGQRASGDGQQEQQEKRYGAAVHARSASTCIEQFQNRNSI